MVRRLFWLGLGVAVGALVVRKILKTTHSYSPRGLAESMQGRVANMRNSARAFVDDVRIGMAEREDQLTAAMSDNLSADLSEHQE